MTLEELKAAAYDAIRQIDMWQQKAAELNRAISSYKPEITATPNTTSETTGTDLPKEENK